MTSAIAPVVSLADGRAVTTSQDVAGVFGRKHRNVLQAIEALRADCPPDFDLLNFQQGSYTTPSTGGQQHKLYTLTRDGFTLLAMGFTGKRALEFKLAYIEAFNRMEAAVRGIETPAPAATFVLPPVRRAYVRFHVGMSGELHRLFKLKAIQEGTSIKDRISLLVQRDVDGLDVKAMLSGPQS